jgi:hypothetical protein
MISLMVVFQRRKVKVISEQVSCQVIVLMSGSLKKLVSLKTR